MYFTVIEYSRHCCRWFVKINRKDAEKYIMNPGNSFGTFLIRASETAEGVILSLLKHYHLLL